MNKKQKKNLYRIIAAAILYVIFRIIKFDNQYLKFACFMVPYLIEDMMF